MGQQILYLSRAVLFWLGKANHNFYSMASRTKVKIVTSTTRWMCDSKWLELVKFVRAEQCAPNWWGARTGFPAVLSISVLRIIT